MRGTRLAILAALLALPGCNVSSSVSRELGARCDSQDECDERCLDGNRFPDGFCTVNCDSRSDCPGGGSCVELEGGVCLFHCAVSADCAFLGPDWGCIGVAQRGEGEDMVSVCVSL